MKIPQGHTEETVLAAIEMAVSSITRSKAFGIHSCEDLKQEGRLLALEKLEDDDYDPSRPLANFLYAHVKNRLSNHRRDTYHRNDPPCGRCKIGDFCDDGRPCNKFANWKKINRRKANLQAPTAMGYASNDCETQCDNVVNDVSLKEILLKIDLELPVELRAYYLKMRAGESVPASKRRLVEQAVKEIVKWQDEPV